MTENHGPSGSQKSVQPKLNLRAASKLLVFAFHTPEDACAALLYKTTARTFSGSSVEIDEIYECDVVRLG